MLTWEKVDGEKTAKARLVARGYRGPDLRLGNVDVFGCLRRRSFHLHLIPMGALKKWPLRSLDVKRAFRQADGFGREVYFRAHS